MVKNSLKIEKYSKSSISVTDKNGNEIRITLTNSGSAIIHSTSTVKCLLVFGDYKLTSNDSTDFTLTRKVD